MSYQPNPLESPSALSVNTGYQTWFYDSWSAALDTTDKWTVTGTAPTVSAGLMTMSATVSTYNTLRTKDNIRANVGYAHVRNGIQLETTAATGAGRFWGLGTNATTPAAAVLVQDGIGFEIDQAAGSLLAVTYAAGVRTTVGTLTRPTDGGIHAYGLSFRATRAYWFIDDLTNPVLSITFPNVQVAILPALIVRQNAASFTGTPVFANTAHLTADTSRQGTVLSDPDIGTRQARVGKQGGLSIKGAGQAAVTTNLAAAATGNTAAVDVSEAGNCTFIVKNTVAASPFGAGGVLVFEQSDDSVSWAPLAVVRQDGVVMTSATLGANTASTSQIYDAPLEGVNYVRARLTSAVTTNGVTIVISAGGLPFTPVTAVIQQPIARGVQGTTGITTQDLKDAGRSDVVLSATGIASIVAETVIPVNIYSGSTSTASQTVYNITTGKRYRLQALRFAATFATPSATVTFANVTIRVRASTTAGATVTSPLVMSFRIDAASNFPGQVNEVPIPDGLEWAGPNSLVITQAASAAGTLLVDVTAVGMEY